MVKIQKLRLLSLLTFGVICSPQFLLGQTGTSVNRGDWPGYHGGPLAQRYSPLDQINAENASDLELVWRFSTANFGPTTDFNNPSTPIEIDGVLYANIMAAVRAITA